MTLVRLIFICAPPKIPGYASLPACSRQVTYFLSVSLLPRARWKRCVPRSDFHCFRASPRDMKAPPKIVGSGQWAVKRPTLPTAHCPLRTNSSPYCELLVRPTFAVHESQRHLGGQYPTPLQIESEVNPLRRFQEFPQPPRGDQVTQFHLRWIERLPNLFVIQQSQTFRLSFRRSGVRI